MSNTYNPLEMPHELSPELKAYYNAVFILKLSISALGFGMLLLYRHLMKKGRHPVKATIDSPATVSKESVVSQINTDSMPVS